MIDLIKPNLNSLALAIVAILVSSCGGSTPAQDITLKNTAPRITLTAGQQFSVDLRTQTLPVAIGQAQYTSSDSSATLGFSLNGANASVFSIDQSGNLSLPTTPNPQLPSYALNVSIHQGSAAGNVLASTSVTVGITYSTEPTLQVSLTAGQQFSVDLRTQSLPVAIGQAQYTSSDPSAVLGFSLSGANASVFSIDQSGNLSLPATPSPQMASYIVTVNIHRGSATGTMLASADVTVGITYPAVPTLQVSLTAGQQFSVDLRTQTPPVVIGQVQHTSSNPSAALGFSLSGANSSVFSIDQMGRLSLPTAPNPQMASYMVTVNAHRGDTTGGILASTNVAINITYPTQITPTASQQFSSDLRDPSPSFPVALGQVQYVSSNPSDSLGFSLSGENSNVFSIDQTGRLSLPAAPTLKLASYTVTVNIHQGSATGAILTSTNVAISLIHPPDRRFSADLRAPSFPVMIGRVNFTSSDPSVTFAYSLDGANAGILSKSIRKPI